MGKIMLTPVTNDKFPLQIWSRSIGMYEVTEQNWPEYFVRIRLYQELVGTPLLKYTDTNEPVEITPELAKQHIGCHLGDSTQERDAWWLRLMHDRAKSLEYQARDFDPDVFPLSDDEDDAL